jgi:putative protease
MAMIPEFKQAVEAVTVAPCARRPEVLAPAGDEEMMRAAVENGADAIYFGVEDFNARLRADNFRTADLPRVMAWLHERGVRGYVTLNTLVFCCELEQAARLLAACSDAGVDAVLVQDLGVAALARRLVPDLPVHSSTQMTLTSAEGILMAHELGLALERVVAARELSVKELRLLRRNAPCEVEAFIHGALCVAYSGQCLTSEALGGRSANRGECAQACRLPYDLIVDGAPHDTGDARYVLSPKDLAAYGDIARLTEAGIAAFKIEGRLKSPMYVAATVQAYRRAVNEAWERLEAAAGTAAGTAELAMDEPTRQALEMTFSRGFTGGYLHEINHQEVVEGRFPKKRGLYLGRVAAVDRRGVAVRLERPLKPGDGVVFDAGRPDEDEEGGRVYELWRGGERLDRFEPWDSRCGEGADSRSSASTSASLGGRGRPPQGAASRDGDSSGRRGADTIVLTFGTGRVNLRRVRPGDRVWKTSDPEIDRALAASYAEGRVHSKRRVWAAVSGAPGCPLRLRLTDEEGVSVEVADGLPAEHAEKHALDEDALWRQLSRLGDTPFELAGIDVEIEGRVMVPFSRLNDLRRRAVEALLSARRRRGAGRHKDSSALEEMRAGKGRAGWQGERSHGRDARATTAGDSTQMNGVGGLGEPLVTGSAGGKLCGLAAADQPVLSVLCRSLEQVEAAVEAGGVDAIYTDFEDVRAHRLARDLVPPGGPRFIPATLRVMKPGEAGIVRKLLAAQPDAVLVRNLGAWRVLREAAPGLELLGDYARNVANDITARILVEQGLRRLTPSYDLNADQLADLLRAAPPEWFEITILQHLPMFHMEHCVFCRYLSTGTDWTNCGRPCEAHTLALRDRMGYEHPVKADAGCRNTVYNAVAQSGSEYLAAMLAAGVRRFRIEFLNEDANTVREAIARHLPVIRGEADGRALWRELRAVSKLGVTRGSLDHD